MLDTVKIGRNGFGNIVLFCTVCHETFGKKEIDDITIRELIIKAEAHKCNPSDVAFVEQLKNQSQAAQAA